jgi:hypothetical protein
MSGNEIQLHDSYTCHSNVDFVSKINRKQHFLRLKLLEIVFTIESKLQYSRVDLK